MCVFSINTNVTDDSCSVPGPPPAHNSRNRLAPCFRSRLKELRRAGRPARARVRTHALPPYSGSMRRRQGQPFSPGDLDTSTPRTTVRFEGLQRQCRDYQLVLSPTARHWLEQAGPACAAASAAGAIQGLLRCQRAEGAAEAKLKQEDALEVPFSSSRLCWKVQREGALRSKSHMWPRCRCMLTTRETTCMPEKWSSGRCSAWGRRSLWTSCSARCCPRALTRRCSGALPPISCSERSSVRQVSRAAGQQG